MSNRRKAPKTQTPVPKSVRFDHKSFTEYAPEIISYLKSRENSRPQHFKVSNQLSNRSAVVILVQQIGEKLEFSRNTVHLAVFYLDLFMDGHDILLNRLNMVAVVCLFVAAKVEDFALLVPKYSEVRTMVAMDYTVNEYFNCECMLLQLFNWDLTFPTAATFMDIFLCTVANQRDFKSYSQLSSKNNPEILKCDSFQEFLSAVSYTTLEILDLSLFEIDLSRATPSLLAAASIAAARYFFYLPFWNPTLEAVTGYPFDALQTVVHALISLKSKERADEGTGPCFKRQKLTPESGYLSSTLISDDSD